MIEHFKSCSPDYPEKLEGEAPQATTRMRCIDTIIYSCNDCGAMFIRPLYTDLEPYKFRDETSQFDPAGEWQGGTECYMRDFTVYIPARLRRRRPDLIDEFIAKYHDSAEWLYTGRVAFAGNNQA